MTIKVTPENLRLTLDGKPLVGATSVTIQRSLFKTASTLTVSAPAITFREWHRYPQRTITAHADENAIFTGIVDAATASFRVSPQAADQRAMLTARSRTALLEDVTMHPFLDPEHDGNAPQAIDDFKNQSMEYIIGQIVNHFKVVIKATPGIDDKILPDDAGLIPAPTQRADAFIRQIAARRNAFITDDGNGYLWIIDKRGRQENKGEIQEQNLINAKATVNAAQRYYKVIVYANNKADAGGVVGQWPDTTGDIPINKQREIAIAPKQTLDENDAAELAKWHIRRQQANRTLEASLMQGYLYAPGDLISVHAPHIGFGEGATDVVIITAQITISGKSGATAKITAAPAAAISPYALPDAPAQPAAPAQ